MRIMDEDLAAIVAERDALRRELEQARAVVAAMQRVVDAARKCRTGAAFTGNPPAWRELAQAVDDAESRARQATFARE